MSSAGNCFTFSSHQSGAWEEGSRSPPPSREVPCMHTPATENHVAGWLSKEHCLLDAHFQRANGQGRGEGDTQTSPDSCVCNWPFPLSKFSGHVLWIQGRVALTQSGVSGEGVSWTGRGGGPQQPVT